MGGLLSIFDPTPEAVPNYRNQNTGYESYPYGGAGTNTNTRSRTTQDTELLYHTYRNQIPSYNKVPATNTRANTVPLSSQVIGRRNRLVDFVEPSGTPSEDLVTLPVSEQRVVRELIWNLQVDIEEFYKVKNEFLKGMYELKKAEYKSRHSCPPEEKWLIHATARTNVKDIIKNNFDWRKVSRIKYGAGTSFTNNADYANYYCNNRKGDVRAFIICKVLIFNMREEKGNERPPNDYDTSLGKARNGARIYVKYDDNEFLPVYVAYYTSSNELYLGSQYHQNVRPINGRQYRGRRGRYVLQ